MFFWRIYLGHCKLSSFIAELVTNFLVYPPCPELFLLLIQLGNFCLWKFLPLVHHHSRKKKKEKYFRDLNITR